LEIYQTEKEEGVFEGGEGKKIGTIVCLRSTFTSCQINKCPDDDLLAYQ
jgi:hypothetical protein